MFAGKRPDNLGVTNGRLIACKRSPNCVSSQADPGDAEHYIAPIPFRGDAITALRKLLHAMERVTVVREGPNYLYAEFRSKLMGYVDDVEFFHEPAAGLIQVRSASRLGVALTGGAADLGCLVPRRAGAMAAFFDAQLDEAERLELVEPVLDLADGVGLHAGVNLLRRRLRPDQSDDASVVRRQP
jgi:uncharacterized protein (DUF1499 family)